MKRRLTRLTTALLLTSTTQVSFAQTAIPLADDDFYYRIGGGRMVSFPATPDRRSFPMGFDGDLGLGYHCGNFNPAASIRNTINKLKGSFQDIDKAIITNLTGAVVTFPMYMLSQVNPNLYKIINNNLIGAHKQLELAMKNCEQMESELADGKNPYDNWARISMGNTWRKEISLAGQTGQGDAIQSKRTVSKDKGQSGVPWLDGKPAGGKNQPPIAIVGDTITAGFNALLNRSLTDTSTVKSSNSHLTQTWKNPQEAKAWVKSVLGEKTITTCDDSECKNKQKTEPGRGLIPWMETCSTDNQDYCAPNLRDKLMDLVSGHTPLSHDALQAVSAKGLMITPDIIETLKQFDPMTRSISIEKLAHAMSFQHVIDRALLARRLLISGQAVPAISSNDAANQEIQQLIQGLDSQLDAIRYEQQVRMETTSNVLTLIMNQRSQHLQKAHTLPRLDKENPPQMQHGALRKEKKA